MDNTNSANRHSAWHEKAKHSAPVLLYHANFSEPPADLVDNLHNVAPAIMHRQLAMLKSRFQFVFVDELAESGCRPGLAAVTFDDGYLTVLDEALEVLTDLEIPCTVFLNGCTFDNRIFWRDKVRFIINNQLVAAWNEFTANRFTVAEQSFYYSTKDPANNSKAIDQVLDQFLASQHVATQTFRYCLHEINQLKSHPLVAYGNHSHHHFVLSSLTESEQYEEIRATHELLQRIPGIQTSALFSIPFGKPRHFNAGTLRCARALGYTGVLLSRDRLNFSPPEWQENLPLLERFMMPTTDNSLNS
ncbi:MAG: polysaccharide deacetylase family protein [Candidatus Competibacteraceae bacterium]|nr:polysaccharide deacetylase family protein [Candidatus Competibacteraceae bacterium]